MKYFSMYIYIDATQPYTEIWDVFPKTENSKSSALFSEPRVQYGKEWYATSKKMTE